MSSEDRVLHQESSNKTIPTRIPPNQHNHDTFPLNGPELSGHPTRSGGQPDHLSPLPCSDSKRSTRRLNPKGHGFFFFFFQHITKARSQRYVKKKMGTLQIVTSSRFPETCRSTLSMSFYYLTKKSKPQREYFFFSFQLFLYFGDCGSVGQNTLPVLS